VVGRAAGRFAQASYENAAVKIQDAAARIQNPGVNIIKELQDAGGGEKRPIGLFALAFMELLFSFASGWADRFKVEERKGSRLAEKSVDSASLITQETPVVSTTVPQA